MTVNYISASAPRYEFRDYCAKVKRYSPLFYTEHTPGRLSNLQTPCKNLVYLGREIYRKIIRPIFVSLGVLNNIKLEDVMRVAGDTAEINMMPLYEWFKNSALIWDNDCVHFDQGAVDDFLFALKNRVGAGSCCFDSDEFTIFAENFSVGYTGQNLLQYMRHRLNPPATEATLKINGISVLMKDNMAFPVGHVLPDVQPGNINDYTPSEAFGYAMRVAIKAEDKEFYQQLLNGYLFLVNQTTIYRRNIGWAPMQGLVGWSPNIVNAVNGLSPYPPNLPNKFVSAASDADEDILNSLMAATTLWPEMQAQDLTTANPDIPNKPIKDLALLTLQNLMANDVGTFTFNDKSYTALTLDNWGHDVLFPDYFDPLHFSKMWEFVKDNYTGADKDQLLNKIIAAAQGTALFVQDVANANEQWIPDSPYNMEGAQSFGYDAVRILMRYGEYLLQGDPLSLSTQISDVLKI